jgi:hypothetical protein
MSSHEEILCYFKRKANEFISKYSVINISPDYDNQHLRLSSYFGQFNENMIQLDNDLGKETANILSNYVNEDMDIPNIIDGLCAYSYNAKLQYISLNNP